MRQFIMKPRRFTVGLFSALLIAACLARPAVPAAQENPFPVLPGLENAVEFWRLVFTKYGGSEVIFHDRQDPLKIYKVVNIEDNSNARKLVREEIAAIGEAEGFEEPEKRVRAQRGVRDRFAAGLALSRRYLDQMQKIMREEGLPEEIAYLPLVESSFNLHARSSAGALGMWQFMPATGRQFMRVGSALDERRDPIESTRAAARFLSQNYDALGNWPLALTAYNHGREGMARAVVEVGSSDLVEIIQRYQSPSFGFASKSFYAEFLAAVDVARRGAEFFPELEYHPPLPLEELPVERKVSIVALLKPTDISHAQFLEWNPALTSKTREVPGGYRIKAPPDKLEALVAAYKRIVGASKEGAAKIVAVSKTSLDWVLHHVAPGDTLSKIARTYKVSVNAIQQANGMNNAHRLSIGQQLKIPKKT
jgi:membrane-bound lytic murein transglycosylase D